VTRNRAFNLFAAAVMAAGLTAWPADAFAQQRGGGSGRGGSQGGQAGRGAAPQGQSRPRTGPATGQAVQRPAGRYPGGGYGYRPYYGGYRNYYPYYRGYYAPYYGYGYGWGWGLSVGWGWDGWYGWGYPYGAYGYGQYYPYYPYPFHPYYYYYEPGVDLRIEVTPRDAEVYLDGYLVGVVDNFDGTFQRLRVPYGEHSIAIYFQGYRTIEQKMLFRPGESYKIKQAMVALAAGDPAEPRPTPAAAPPRDEYARPPMRDQYGRPPAPGGPPEMAPPSEARGDFGSIAIRVQPGDAEILIDGERWEAPGGGGRLVVDLAEGNHVVEIRKDGHKPYSADVQVRRGRTSSLNVSLPPGL